MTEYTKTAIVTGGLSGIGKGLVDHLLSKPNWRVVIADIRGEAYTAIAGSLDPKRHLFIQTNVVSWEEQAALFKQAYAWSGERIDFFAANAGTADKQHITATPWDLDAEPPKPDLLTSQVNQDAVFYGLRLFVHYARKTNLALKSAAEGEQTAPAVPYNPKMVITSSCAGLYPFPLAPVYNASKHGVLALTRAVGKTLLASDNIAVNCIMPAYVDTPLTPREVTDLWPPEWITPISTMLRAYDELTAEDGGVTPDGKSDGKPGKVKAGESVECVVDKLYYRRPVEYADESQRFLIEQTFIPDGVWIKGMTEMFRKKQEEEQQRAATNGQVAA